MVHRAISTGDGAVIHSWTVCAGVARVTAPKLSRTTGQANSAWNAEASSVYWSSPSSEMIGEHHIIDGCEGFLHHGRTTATSPPCSICPVARETFSRLYRGLRSETSVSMKQCGTERRRRWRRPPGPVSQAQHASATAKSGRLAALKGSQGNTSDGCGKVCGGWMSFSAKLQSARKHNYFASLS